MTINTDHIDLYISKTVTAEKLSMTVRTLDKRAKEDPDFPKPIKMGPNRQSPVKYLNSEIDAYMQGARN